MNAPAVRAPSTERAYRRRGDLLLRAWRRECGGLGESPLDFADWLMERLRDLRAATRRQYRAAAFAVMPTVFAGHPGLRAAAERLREAMEPAVRPPRRTSARKLKFLPAEDWERLSGWLLANERTAAASVSWRVIEAWCRATLLCGLRPTEWFSARFEDRGDGFVVVVRNAKATQGRSHGETRSLLFEHASERDRHAIMTTVETAREWAARGQGATLQKLVSDGLHRAARAALGPRAAYPSLYTFRHQAIANWKVERDEVEVAALCGHASVETAGEHYAGRRRAWRGRRPPGARPTARDVEAVLRAVRDARDPTMDAPRPSKPSGVSQVTHDFRPS